MRHFGDSTIALSLQENFYSAQNGSNYLNRQGDLIARRSIDVPCYNEQYTLVELMTQVCSALRHSQIDFVDEGSTDASWWTYRGKTNVGLGKRGAPSKHALLYCKIPNQGHKSLISQLGIFGFLILFFATCGACFGQVAIYAVADGKTITDPDVVLSNIAFLSEASVAKEVGLEETQRREINALLNETSGLPSIVFFKNPYPPALEMRQSLQKDILQERENRVNEILDPIQRERLKQVVYQIEISRAGLGNALIEGHLGRDAGIEDYEKPGLKIIFDALRIEVTNAKNKLFRSIEQEILDELTGEQVLMYRNSIGQQVHLQETSEERTMRKHNEKRDVARKLPNPESLFEVCLFLEISSVAEELNVSELQIKQIRQLRKESIKSQRDETAFQMAIKAIISQDQITRLKQVGYQWEVAKIGLGSAIGRGYLGNAIGVRESERAVLQLKLSKIDTKAEEGNVQLENAASDRFMAELTSHQRAKASRLIGKPFSFRE